jgi:hypothetical protein
MSNNIDDVSLDDITPTSHIMKIPVEVGRSMSQTLCKRCSHIADKHRNVALPNGSHCDGADGDDECGSVCPGFL